MIDLEKLIEKLRSDAKDVDELISYLESILENQSY